jgi:ribokinase
VNTGFLCRDASPLTGIALITVDDGGQNAIVVVPCANSCAGAGDMPVAESAIRAASLRLAQPECSLDAVARAIGGAKASTIEVVLNLGPAQVLDQGLLAWVDYLAPNRSELRPLARGQ